MLSLLNRSKLSCRKQQGFTLIELITVILLLGIVVVGAGNFIAFGTRIFVDSSNVDQVLSDSRYALQRMTRELRTALPNSVRVASGVNYQCLEFVPTITSSTYLDLPFANESSTGANSGTVLLEDTSTQIAQDQRAYVYPLSADDIYGDIVLENNIANAIYAEIISVAVANNIVTLNFPNSPATRFRERAPQQRIYFTGEPISYCFTNGQLLRYTSYGFHQDQPVIGLATDLANGNLLAENIANVLAVDDYPIQVSQSSLVNNAIIQIQPRFSVNGEQVQYRHQVQVINVP